MLFSLRAESEPVWLRLDDHYADHPKVVGLSDAAFRLHVRAMCYAAAHLTDGFVPEGWLRGSTVEATELVTAGLFVVQAGGYRLHDWHDHNPTTEAVKARRAANRERQRRFAKKRWAATNAVSDSVSNDAPVPVPVPVPSLSSSEELLLTPPPARPSRVERATAGFEEFWTAYPRKVGKGDCQRIWGKLPAADRTLALAAAQEFGSAWGVRVERQGRAVLSKCPHPSTWLNGKRWEDDLALATLAAEPAGRQLAPEPEKRNFLKPGETPSYTGDHRSKGGA